MTIADERIPHLRPMEAEQVHLICDRVRQLCPDSYVVLQEANGLRRDRTPWDARRLANALANYEPGNVTPEIAEIIAELDRMALEKAGLKPGRRPHLEGEKRTKR